jgi:hypothetical protein
LPNKRITHVLREVGAQKKQPTQTPRPLAGGKPGPTARDDEGSPFDENYQKFVQTQTIRDETRTAGLQEQMDADTLASYTRDEDGFGTRLSDRLDEVQPDTRHPQDDETKEPPDDKPPDDKPTDDKPPDSTPPTKPPTEIGCDKITKQGANTPETFVVELGQKSGSFIFEYNMYNVPDRILVEYEGKKTFDTGCVGNRQGAGKGVGSKTITYSGSSTKVTVKVLPSCEGGTTKWTFTANCPTKPPTKAPPTKKVLDWHSSSVCAEAEGSEYRWRWNVNLTQSGTQVSGHIYFHKCPGGGRAAYAVSGEIGKGGSFEVTGNKIGGRGGLYSSAPKSRTFILNKGKAPNPNFAP